VLQDQPQIWAASISGCGALVLDRRSDRKIDAVGCDARISCSPSSGPTDMFRFYLTAIGCFFPPNWRWSLALLFLEYGATNRRNTARFPSARGLLQVTGRDRRSPQYWSWDESRMTADRRDRRSRLAVKSERRSNLSRARTYEIAFLKTGVHKIARCNAAYLPCLNFASGPPLQVQLRISKLTVECFRNRLTFLLLMTIGRRETKRAPALSPDAFFLSLHLTKT